jgi:hypothetical protein
MSNREDWEKGFHSKQPSADFQYGSHQWEGALDAERSRARQAANERAAIAIRAASAQQAASAQGAASARVATRSDGWVDETVELGPRGWATLEGGILSCVALYRNWPQYLSLYSSFPRLNVLGEYGVAAGLVLLSAIFYLLFCSASKLFTWGSFIVSGAFLAAWSRPWGLNWRTCLAGFLVLMMFLYRRALRSEAA